MDIVLVKDAVVINVEPAIVDSVIFVLPSVVIVVMTVLDVVEDVALVSGFAVVLRSPRLASFVAAVSFVSDVVVAVVVMFCFLFVSSVDVGSDVVWFVAGVVLVMLLDMLVDVVTGDVVVIVCVVFVSFVCC